LNSYASLINSEDVYSVINDDSFDNLSLFKIVALFPENRVWRFVRKILLKRRLFFVALSKINFNDRSSCGFQKKLYKIMLNLKSIYQDGVTVNVTRENIDKKNYQINVEILMPTEHTETIYYQRENYYNSHYKIYKECFEYERFTFKEYKRSRILEK